MKFEIDDNQLIDKIANKVIQQLSPLLKQNPKNNDNELMTVEETAKYLKVSKSFVYEKIHKKEIPFHKVGKFPRFRKSHIDIWIKNPYHPALSIYNLNAIERG